MIPFGFRDASVMASMSGERISAKTPSSRARRAMSCVNWDPKSRMSSRSWLMVPLEVKVHGQLVPRRDGMSVSQRRREGPLPGGVDGGLVEARHALNHGDLLHA